MNNIHSLFKKWKALISLYHQQLIESPKTSSTQSFRITRGDLLPVYPYLSKICCRVKQNSTIMETAKVNQSRSPVWEHDFMIYGDEPCTLELVQFYNDKEVILAKGNIYDGVITLGQIGNVTCQRIHQNHVDFILDRIRLKSFRIEQQTIQGIANLVCNNFHQKFKRISKEYKTSLASRSISNIKSRLQKSTSNSMLASSVMSNLSKKRNLSASNLSQTMDHYQIEQSLTPLFEYLNTNLGLFTSEIPDLSLDIVASIWKLIISGIRGLIAPPLFGNSNDNQIQAMDDNRLLFIKISVELLVLFFKGDGDGLDDLSGVSEINKMTEHYFKSKTVLRQMYNESRNKQEDEWILLLLNEKNDVKFVEDSIRERALHFS